MTLAASLLVFFAQGKIALVKADQLVTQSTACILVKPEKGPGVTVTRIILGLRP